MCLKRFRAPKRNYNLNLYPDELEFRQRKGVVNRVYTNSQCFYFDSMIYLDLEVSCCFYIK